MQVENSSVVIIRQRKLAALKYSKTCFDTIYVYVRVRANTQKKLQYLIPKFKAKCYVMHSAMFTCGCFLALSSLQAIHGEPQCHHHVHTGRCSGC